MTAALITSIMEYTKAKKAGKEKGKKREKEREPRKFSSASRCTAARWLILRDFVNPACQKCSPVKTPNKRQTLITRSLSLRSPLTAYQQPLASKGPRWKHHQRNRKEWKQRNNAAAARACCYAAQLARQPTHSSTLLILITPLFFVYYSENVWDASSVR